MKRLVLVALAAYWFGGAFADTANAMCYKPAAGQKDYPWTRASWWFAAPESGTTANRVPTLEDGVLLYSSKNIAVPLRVGADVHAETADLRFGTSAWGANNPQAFLVEQGGSMTNSGSVAVGGNKADSNTAGHLVVAGDWNTLGNFDLGRSKNASTLTVTETGHFVNTNTVPVDSTDDAASTMVVGAIAPAVPATSVVTNRGAMELFDLHCGSGGTTASGVIENFGTVHVRRKFTIGRHGFGRFHLHRGGQLLKEYFHSKPVLIGHSAGAVGEVQFDDDVSLLPGDTVQLGNGEKSRGTLVVDDARLEANGNLYLANGLSSRADLELRNGAALNFDNGATLQLGRQTGAVARVTLRGTSRLDNATELKIPQGECATGVVEVLDRACITNLTTKRIVLAEPRETRGELIVGDDAFVGPLTNLSICTVREVPSAQVTLRGGTIGLAGGAGGVWTLFLGQPGQKVTKARIRGWGRLMRTGSDTLMVRMTAYGQIIADGEGAARDLDLHEIRTVGRSNSDNTNPTGSNGWYAVSQGRLAYPRVQEINGNSHPVVGDYPNRATPILVNSLRFTMDAYPTKANYHAYAELYAADRTDYPRGLPVGEKDAVKGVWRLAFSSGNGLAVDPEPVAFSGLKLQIRHDVQDIPEDAFMDVWHHDGTETGAWRRVMKSAPFDPANNLLQTTEKVDPSSAAWNAGWFAVVARARPTGCVVVIR